MGDKLAMDETNLEALEVVQARVSEGMEKEDSELDKVVLLQGTALVLTSLEA